jgi:hypothetical protein
VSRNSSSLLARWGKSYWGIRDGQLRQLSVWCVRVVGENVRGVCGACGVCAWCVRGCAACYHQAKRPHSAMRTHNQILEWKFRPQLVRWIGAPVCGHYAFPEIAMFCTSISLGSVLKIMIHSIRRLNYLVICITILQFNFNRAATSFFAPPSRAGLISTQETEGHTCVNAQRKMCLNKLPN